MSDNASTPYGVIAADECTVDGTAGVKVQRMKLGYGIGGTYTSDAALTFPFPVNAASRTDVVQAGDTQCVPKFAVINLSATGTVVAAVSGKKIRVVSLFMCIDLLTGDETYTFKSGAAGTAITGAIGDSSGAGAVVPVSMAFSPLGHFETATSALLELSLAGTTPFANGVLTYIEV